MPLGLHRIRGRACRYPTSALLAELRRVAALVRGNYTLKRFEMRSRVCPATIQKRFGTWREALRRAGLMSRIAPRSSGNKYTWEECYANMERLWRHYKRAPRKWEANGPPSRITSETYYHRFGCWGNALAAFVAYRGGDISAWPMPGTRSGPQQKARAHGAAFRATIAVKRETLEGKLRLSVQLRYKVLLRDHFRCTLCGANPAADPSVILHVDHVAPQAAGGKTAIENLRTLCAPCNVGKGASQAEGAGAHLVHDAPMP